MNFGIFKWRNVQEFNYEQVNIAGEMLHYE